MPQETPSADLLVDFEEVWAIEKDHEYANRPVKTACKRGQFGYPNYTLDGHMMYENMHFQTEGEAWEKLIQVLEASQRMDVADLRQAEKRLRDVEQRLAQGAARFTEAKDLYAAWRADQPVIKF